MVSVHVVSVCYHSLRVGGEWAVNPFTYVANIPIALILLGMIWYGRVQYSPRFLPEQIPLKQRAWLEMIMFAAMITTLKTLLFSLRS